MSSLRDQVRILVTREIIEAFLETMEVDDDHFLVSGVQEGLDLHEDIVECDFRPQNAMDDPQFLRMVCKIINCHGHLLTAFLMVTFDWLVGHSKVQVSKSPRQLIENRLVMANHVFTQQGARLGMISDLKQQISNCS